MEINESIEDRKASRLDYAVAILLGLATILGAACAYFSNLWGGEQSKSYTRGVLTLSESNTRYLEALTESNSLELSNFTDDFMYVQWDQARAKGNKADADYYLSRMSDELRKVVESDIHADPDSIDAAHENFLLAQESMVAYQDSIMNLSIKQAAESNGIIANGDKANDYGDKFTFMTVMFTIVMFFGGMSAVSNKLKLKQIYAMASVIVFVFTLIQMFLLKFPDISF